MPDLNEIYSFLWTVHGEEFATLDRSLHPRSWEYVFELAAGASIKGDSIVADLGCGRGHHSFELGSRFGCRVIGMDAVFPQIEAVMRERGGRILFVTGSIENIPIRDASVDFVWCRDMLVHVGDVSRALCESSRILRRGGRMLVYTTFETDLMEPREAARIYEPLAIHPLRRDPLERGFDAAGLDIAHREEIGSELIEFYEERDGRASRELMRIARMRHIRDQLVEQWGAQQYETVLALYHWMIYLLLGKLSAAYYVLERRSEL